MATNGNSSPTNAVSAQTFAAGQKVLNRYTLERVLGQGGMGVVWLAQDDELDRKVALKFLPSLVINDRSSLNDLKRETRRSLELTHPNIVRTYDFLQDATLAGISMEYVDSDTLRNRRLDQPNGVFQPGELGDWTAQLCDALDYAHKHAAIVHRDLKPANLLVNTRNQLKVADFGISRSIVESVTQVTGNVSSGTLVYMSPQQLDGDLAQPSDDIYAVGATLYELCTSRPPFFTGDVYRQVHGKLAPSMAARRTELGVPHGELPENWETTVAACLAKDPLQRPQSAGEIAVRLGLREAASITVAATTRIAPPPIITANGGNPPTAQTATVSPLMASPATATAPFAPGAVIPPPLTSTSATKTSFNLPAAVPMFLGKRKSWGPMAAVAAAVLVLLVGGIWLLGSHSGKGTKAPVNTARDNHNGSPVKTTDNSSSPPSYADDYSGQPGAPGPGSGTQGNLFVETEPPGAKVTVDDRPAETTPISLSGLAPGAHTLKVSMDGYDDYTSQVSVKENQATPLAKVTLVRSTGQLNVTTNPPGAEFVVNGPGGPVTPAHAVSPWSSGKLPVGDYEVDITRSGGAAPLARKVSLAKDQTLPVTIDLTLGSVEIDSDPPGASVIVDGKFLGKTPYTADDVPPGNVTYSLSYVDYPPATVQGQVGAGQLLKLNASFTKTDAVAKTTPAPDKAAASTHSRTRRSRSSNGDDDDNNKHGDTLDKANRAADLMNKLRWMGGHFPHP